MNWLFPGFLAGAGLIALPVILHFLRRRQTVVVRFPSLRFLGETALRDTRRHQLLRWLTLLMRCLAIALLVAAFARPFWLNAAASHRQLMVVAIDNSMSMQVAGRWQTLQSWALKQMDGLAPGDQAGVLVMNPSPVWLVPLTDEIERARSTLQMMRPGFEKTHYAGALKMAGEALVQHAGGTKSIVWMADEQRAGWRGVDFDQPLPLGVHVIFADPSPEPKHQAAITSLQWSADKPGLIANVRLFAPLEDERRISVCTGEKTLTHQSVKLRNGDNKIMLPFSPPATAPGFRVAMDPDDLASDDTAWITPSKTGSNAILLDAVDGTDFLTHALRSTEKMGTVALKAEPLPEKIWTLNSVVILRGNNAFEPPRLEHLDRFFDAGGALWIFLGGSGAQLDWLKKHGIAATPRKTSDDAWHLRNWDPEHPALAAFAGQSLLPLLNVTFHRGMDLTGTQLAPLAEWPDGKVAIAEWSDGGHRLLLTGFSMNRTDTDWPTQPSFVPFVHQTARWLGSFSDMREDWRVGDTISLPASEGTWRVLDGSPAPERKVGAGVRPDAPGLYEYQDGSLKQVFAVNTPPEESDLAPWPKPGQFSLLESKEFPAHTQTQAAAPLNIEVAESQQRLWWWVLAGCGLVILAELALANRTAT